MVEIPPGLIDDFKDGSNTYNHLLETPWAPSLYAGRYLNEVYAP